MIISIDTRRVQSAMSMPQKPPSTTETACMRASGSTSGFKETSLVSHIASAN